MQAADAQVYEIISAVRGLASPAASVGERAAHQRILTQVQGSLLVPFAVMVVEIFALLLWFVLQKLTRGIFGRGRHQYAVIK